MNNTVILSVGNIKNFHTIESNKKIEIYSIFFFPFGTIHIYLIGFNKKEKKLFFCYKNTLKNVLYENLKNKHVPVVFKNSSLTLDQNEIENKFKNNINYFYTSPKEEREFILKELENRIKNEKDRENLAIRKLLFYFSFFTVFFGYLMSKISYDFVSNLYKSIDIKSHLEIFLYAGLFLFVHISFYAINIILLSLYGLLIRKYEEFSFGDFKKTYPPQIAYFKSLYFKWYQLRNLEVDKFISIVKNIEKFIKLFLLSLLIFFALIFFMKWQISSLEKENNKKEIIFIISNFKEI